MEFKKWEPQPNLTYAKIFKRLKEKVAEMQKDLEALEPLIEITTRMKDIDKCVQDLLDNSFMWPKYFFNKESKNEK